MAQSALKVVEMPTKKKPSFAAAMKATTTKAPAKKKTTMPTLEATKEIRAAVAKFVRAKAENKKSKADMDASGDEIITFVRSRQDDDGFKHCFRNSYAVPGEDGSQVKFVSTNRYSINPDDAEELQQILGDEYGDMILEKFQVNLKEEVLENEDLQGELMELIGDRFSEFFETKQSLAVAEGFDGRVYSVVDKENLPVLRTFVRQYKPSLR